MSISDTLLQIIQIAPAETTAIVLPEAGIRVTYQKLRDQVTAMADEQKFTAYRTLCEDYAKLLSM